MNNWWMWIAGLVLLGFLGSAFLGVTLAIIGVVGLVIFTVLKVIFSIISAIFAPFLGLLMLGGIGYVVYRIIRAMSHCEDDIPHTTYKDRTTGGW